MKLTGNPANEPVMTVRLEVPEPVVAVLNWLPQQAGPFTVRKAMEAFPSLPLNVFHQIFQVASKIGLTHYLWFDPIGQ